MPEAAAQQIYKLRTYAEPKIFGYWVSPGKMYKFCFYEKPTRMLIFAAWMLGWKWENKNA